MALTTSDRPRSRWPGGGGVTGQAWITIVADRCSDAGGSRPRDDHVPRETVTRILKEMERHGLLSVEGREMTVDPDFERVFDEDAPPHRGGRGN